METKERLAFEGTVQLCIIDEVNSNMKVGRIAKMLNDLEIKNTLDQDLHDALSNSLDFECRKDVMSALKFAVEDFGTDEGALDPELVEEAKKQYLGALGVQQ